MIAAPSLRQVIQTTRAPQGQSLPGVRVVNPTPTSKPSSVVNPMQPMQPMDDSQLPINRNKGQSKPKERRSSHNVIEKR